MFGMLRQHIIDKFFYSSLITSIIHRRQKFSIFGILHHADLLAPGNSPSILWRPVEVCYRALRRLRTWFEEIRVYRRTTRDVRGSASLRSEIRARRIEDLVF